MNERTGRRAAGSLVFSRRGKTGDPNQEDNSIQYCSRLGCSSRLNSMKGAQVGNQEKLKYSKAASFRSASSKAIAGSSSKSFSSSSDFRKCRQGQQNRISQKVTVLAEHSSRQREIEDLWHCNRQDLIEDSDSSSRQGEASSRQGEADDLEFGSIASSIQKVLPASEDLETEILRGFHINTTEPLGSGIASLSSKSHKQINQRLGTGKQETSGSSIRHSLVSRSATQAAKPVSQVMGAGPQRYGLKNLGCKSISDVLPSGCSSSNSRHSRRVDSIKKQSCDGEGSSTRFRGMNGSSSSGGCSGSSHNGISGPVPDRSLSHQIPRRARKQTTNRDGAVSVRTRRTPSGETRMRFPDHEESNIVSPSETVAISQLSQIQFSIPEAQSTQFFRDPFGDRENYRHFNMEGIAELLLALDRIEQDEELTYEQLLVLETNLFFGGLGFHDQHRDMRMDIDNMSYEELLALGEEMGTVSTALSEEALMKCLKRSIYEPPSISVVTSHGDDDIKCSICQEEFVTGDEVGKLACEHSYHVICIHQWLKQKNWCPICKASACPS